MVEIPDNYINTILRSNSSYSDIKKELLIFSNRHNFDYDEVTYTFVLHLIKKEKFLKIKEEIALESLYDAIYWSSKLENKKKTRPKNAKSIKDLKSQNKFIHLQKELTKLIFKELNGDILFDEKLVKYLNFFFELSSIKRDRRCTEE